MIVLQLSHDEAVFIAHQLRHHLQTVESELVHTDARRMQHELAEDLERLRALETRLERAIETDYARPTSDTVDTDAPAQPTTSAR